MKYMLILNFFPPSLVPHRSFVESPTKILIYNNFWRWHEKSSKFRFGEFVELFADLYYWQTVITFFFFSLFLLLSSRLNWATTGNEIFSNIFVVCMMLYDWDQVWQNIMQFSLDNKEEKVIINFSKACKILSKIILRWNSQLN